MQFGVELHDSSDWPVLIQHNQKKLNIYVERPNKFPLITFNY